MNLQGLEDIWDNAMERSHKLLIDKNKEYANSNDIFRNFTKGVALSFHDMPEKYLWELMVKHLQSLKDIIEGLETEMPTKELLDAKFGDVISYCILLEAMIIERVGREVNCV